MIVGDSKRECVARAKGLTTAFKYYGIIVDDEETCRRILVGLSPNVHFVREGYALRMNYSLTELEHALVKGEELKEQLDG